MVAGWTLKVFATALTDLRTGLPFAAGGLNLGDYFDATNDEALAGSYTTNGILYNGRYRFVQVDSGATSGNVKTGTVGLLRTGTTVKSVVVTAVGSGQTPGTYSIAAVGLTGGGQNAVIQVVVGSGGTITGASVLQPGFNYVQPPIFSFAVLGGTPGTVTAQLGITQNLVTSYDQSASTVGPTGVASRFVVFLNSITPGNYGFVQELGTATVLGGGSASTALPAYVNVTNNGLITTAAASGSPIGTTIGLAIDQPNNNVLFKAQLAYACVPAQD